MQWTANYTYNTTPPSLKPARASIYVCGLQSVVGLLYELLLSCFIPVVNALPKLQESGMFMNQLLIFLVLFIVDAIVFILFGGGQYLFLLDLILQFELFVAKVNAFNI